MATKTEMKTSVEAPKVSIRIPKIDSEDTIIGGKQYEHVTINGKTTMVEVGQNVEVSPQVYMQLRNKYPDL